MSEGRGALPPLCELSGVTVRYGSLTANRDVSLSVRPGEVVALCGENGAGKSTLLGVLYGLVTPSSGEVRYHGRAVTPSPELAISEGIGMVHQHFMLISPMTVAENVVLGREPRRAGLLRRRHAEAEIRDLSRRFGLDIDPRRLVGELSVGEAQRVEILKVLYRGARLLVLDEPTAVLTPLEVEPFLKVLRAWIGADRAGRGVLIVTHKLDEVMAIADRVVVMRRGEVVREFVRHEMSQRDIAHAMVGRELEPVTRSGPFPGEATQVLEVRELSVESGGVLRVDNVSLGVARGEIFGIAGVEGNGQTELCAALAGLLRARRGQILIGGRDVSGWSVAQRRRAGLSLIPEDRHRHGMVLDFSLMENLMLGAPADPEKGSGLLLRRGRLRRTAQRLLDEYEVQPAAPDAPGRSLSGGNQQKVVVARELRGGAPRLLLAAQPTRGVDIGAVAAIHRRLLAAKQRGSAVLLFSAELDELRALCDRIGVMYRGRLVKVLDNPVGAPLSRASIGEWMMGAGASA